jgi:flagellar hook-basal body complex protein FliE
MAIPSVGGVPGSVALSLSPTAPAQGVAQGFGAALMGALTSLAQANGQAQTLLTQFSLGAPVDPASLMTSVAQADLATEAAVTVVSKALSAYQSLMQMQV